LRSNRLFESENKRGVINLFYVETQNLSYGDNLPYVKKPYKTSSGALTFAHEFMSKNEEQGVLLMYDIKTDSRTWFARFDDCGEWKMFTDAEWQEI
jgi:hypothetical protein